MEYVKILSKAKQCKTNVEKTYKPGININYAYFFAKAIMAPEKKVSSLTFESPSNPTGDSISNQIYKKDYFDMAKRLIAYVEKNKKLPNYISVTLSNKTYKVRVRDYLYMFARILVYYDKNGQFPKYANVNSKSFTKPTESCNAVYDYWVKKFGFKPTSLDEILEYVADHFEYQYYYDDQKSNREVIDSQAGNCTDLLQMLYNLTKQLGYEIEVLHVLCSGGDGHVRGRFKHPKNTGGEWIYRDIACAASSGNPTCNWCTSGYTLLAVNPSWFFENVNR